MFEKQMFLIFLYTNDLFPIVKSVVRIKHKAYTTSDMWIGYQEKIIFTNNAERLYFILTQICLRLCINLKMNIIIALHTRRY